MLCRMKVEHIVDKGPFESRAGARQDGKSCAGDFRGPVEIQNAERFAEIPMALGGAVKVGGVPHRLVSTIAVGVFSYRHRGMWKIRDAEIQIGQGFFDTPVIRLQSS